MCVLNSSQQAFRLTTKTHTHTTESPALVWQAFPINVALTRTKPATMDKHQEIDFVVSLSAFLHHHWLDRSAAATLANREADDKNEVDAEFVWSRLVKWCTAIIFLNDAKTLQQKLAELHCTVEPAASALLPLVAKHGHFKRLQKVWEHTMLAAATSASTSSTSAPTEAATGAATGAATKAATKAAAIKRLADAVVDVVVGFLKADAKVLADAAATSSPVDSKKLSLAGRYVPRTTRRVQKKYGTIAQQLLELKGNGCFYQVDGCRTAATQLAFAKAVKYKLFPDACKTRNKRFRQLLATLNKHLNTVECLMSARRWDEIQPANLPHRVKARYRQAMLYETNDGTVRPVVTTTTAAGTVDAGTVDAGTSLHDDGEQEARLALRARYLADVATFSHENPLNVIRSCLRTSLPADEAAAYNAQWKVVVAQVAKNSLKSPADAASAAATTTTVVSLDNTVVAFDINGLDPRLQMIAGICTGLLASQLSTGAFKNRLVTHQQTPRVYEVLQRRRQEDDERGTFGVLEQVHHMLRELESDRYIDLPAAVSLVLRTAESWALDEHKQGRRFVGENIVPAHFLVLANRKLALKKTGSSSKWTSSEYACALAECGAMHRRLLQAGVECAPPKPPMIVYWNMTAMEISQAVDSDAAICCVDGMSCAFVQNLLYHGQQRLVADEDASGDDQLASCEQQKVREAETQVALLACKPACVAALLKKVKCYATTKEETACWATCTFIYQ